MSAALSCCPTKRSGSATTCQKTREEYPREETSGAAQLPRYLTGEALLPCALFKALC